LFIVFAIIINLLRAYAPKLVPRPLQTWSWLPRPFHTLAWYDEHFFSGHNRFTCCKNTESKQLEIIIKKNNSGQSNQTFDDDDRLSGISSRL
jgi:hypothetical protein